jgi:hypothetical protein
MTKTKDNVVRVGAAILSVATTVSTMLVATPTATFSTVPIAPTTPTTSLTKTQPTPVPLTTWTKKVKPGQVFEITASCYDDSGITKSGVYIDQKVGASIGAVPRGIQKFLPFGTRATISTESASTKIVIADVGRFGIGPLGPNAKEPFERVNHKVMLDLGRQPTQELTGLTSCQEFGEQSITIRIDYMPPTGENPSYSQTTETTTESLAVLQAETQQQEAQIKRQEERNAALEKTTNLDVAGQLKRDQERLLTR